MKMPFQAVTLRYVHDVVAGETLNIGVVLVCQAKPFVGAAFAHSFARVTAAFPNASGVLLRRVRDAVINACAAWPPDGSLFKGANDAAAIIRSALPEESGITLSAPIGGLTADPEATLRHLCDRYVERHTAPDERPSRDIEASPRG